MISSLVYNFSFTSVFTLLSFITFFCLEAMTGAAGFTAALATGFGALLISSWSCFRALSRAFLTMAALASSDNSALESTLAFTSLRLLAGLSFCFIARAALIVF